MRHFPKFLLICFAFAASPALANPYIDSASIYISLLPAPPAETSPERQKEVALMVEQQKTVDANELARAVHETGIRSELMAQDVDAKFTRADYPALYRLLDRVMETANFAASTIKNHWGVARPYTTYPAIKALVSPPHGSPTYPSGHTATSFSMAYVLGILMPDKRDLFLARADEIARHRIMAGVHYPSDIAGGKQLAAFVTGAITENVDFQKDLQEAAKELAAKK